MSHKYLVILDDRRDYQTSLHIDWLISQHFSDKRTKDQCRLAVAGPQWAVTPRKDMDMHN